MKRRRKNGDGRRRMRDRQQRGGWRPRPVILTKAERWRVQSNLGKPCFKTKRKESKVTKGWR